MNRYTTTVILSLLVLLAIAATGIAAPRSAAVATEAPAAEICFPEEDWSTAYGASAEDRPCTTVTRPQEDGSGRLILGTVGADAARCLVPNPYEERGRFVLHCRRIPNR